MFSSFLTSYQSSLKFYIPNGSFDYPSTSDFFVLLPAHNIVKEKVNKLNID